MNNLGTVMSFTMRNKMRSKSFLITTLVLVILVVVGGNVPYLINKLGGGDSVTKVGYIEGQQTAVVQALKDIYGKLPKRDVDLVGFTAKGSQAADVEQMKQKFSNGDIGGFLTFADNTAADFPTATYHSKSALGSGISASLAAQLAAVKNDLLLKNAGLSEDQKTKLNAPVDFKNEQVSLANASGKTAEEQGTAIGMTYVIIILLFMSVMISGQLIATEITAEKSSRVMEIIVTSVSPLTQMWGKIIGTFIVAIMQIVAIVGALVINISLPQNAEAFKAMGIRLDSIPADLVVFAVIFFLMGFFLYATLFAAVGSIVSRTEDLGQAVLPITMLTLVGFYVAIFGLTHPDSPLILVCSFIPFFSPFLMMLRLGLAEPAGWEIGLSVVILIVTILAIGWLSAKIYRAGVLMYGKRPSMKELAKAMKAFKV